MDYSCACHPPPPFFSRPLGPATLTGDQVRTSTPGAARPLNERPEDCCREALGISGRNAVELAVENTETADGTSATSFLSI